MKPIKRLIALVSLSTALAGAGCAHHQVSTGTAVSAGTTAGAIIVGLVIIAASTQCTDCTVSFGLPAREPSLQPPR